MKHLFTFIFLLFLSSNLIAQSEKMEVEGAIIIGDSESATPVPGTIRWTGTDFEGWNGTCWLSLTGLETCAPPQPTDGCGNTYQSIVIGTQEWLTEDLATCNCNDGTPLTEVTDSASWASATTEGYSWYNNDQASTVAAGYGALYNWYAIDYCNICPVGYHVPDEAEWNILIEYLDTGTIDPNFIGTQSYVAGGELREAGFLHWVSPNMGATNSSGWTGLPAGYRHNYTAGFLYQGINGRWWSSTESSASASEAYFRGMNTSSAGIGRNDVPKNIGFAVRCLKD